MKIVIHNNSTGIGHQILDAWQAYRQSTLDNYSNDCEYIFDQVEKVKEYDLSIYCDYMPRHLSSDILKNYDLVLICNGGEPLEVASPFIKQLLEHNHVYFITNAWLDDQHPLKQKNIWFPHNVQTCRDYWTRHFYPQYFENQNFEKLPRNDSIIWISGDNRPNRQCFVDTLVSTVPDFPMHSKINVDIRQELKACQWETAEDVEFRFWCNSQYKVCRSVNSSENYYNNSVTVGIQDRFGSIPPGYFILPLYFENSCVVFPETSWINNEMCITEKAIKCFYSGSLPMPVSGANVNKFYNQIGFYTAWNLLPPEHQEFDQILDHRVRYEKLADSIKWLQDNKHVFRSRLFEELTQKNKINFLTCECDSMSIKWFDQILSKYIS